MKIYSLYSEIEVDTPLETVFSFFDKAQNLETMTPKNLSFKIMTPGDVPMAHGTVIDYVVSIMGIPQRWTSVIQKYNPPNYFVDTQIKGPYSFWYHEHQFLKIGQKTSIIDHVHYAVPFGVLGRLAHWLFIKRQLKGIFSHRLQFITEKFNGNANSAKLEIH